MTEQVSSASTLVREPRPRPERLSDIEMGDLLASVGNHEAKALTLILMSGGNIFTRQDLHQKFTSAQEENPVWKTRVGLQFGYCQQSFEPIGLVAKETLDENLNTYGYQITEKGQNLGNPLAGLLLDFSLRYDVSLQDLFGSTSSSSDKSMNKEDGENSDSIKRSPLARFKIFYDLATNPSSKIRAIDLIKNSDFFTSKGGSLGRHLENLHKRGLLGYDSTERGKPIASYSLIPEKAQDIPNPYRYNPTLTKNLFEAIKSEPKKEWTYEALQEKLKDMFPGYKDRKAMLSINSNILAHLRKEGFVKVNKFSHSEHFRSEITLSEGQRKLITELVSILDGFASKDPRVLAKGRDLAMEIAVNPDKVRRIMTLAKEHSPNANKKSSEERKNQIISIIMESPGITPRELSTVLQAQGKRIGLDHVRDLLRLLSIDGTATFKIGKDASHWYPVKQEASTPQEVEA